MGWSFHPIETKLLKIWKNEGFRLIDIEIRSALMDIALCLLNFNSMLGDDANFIKFDIAKNEIGDYPFFRKHIQMLIAFRKKMNSPFLIQTEKLLDIRFYDTARLRIEHSSDKMILIRLYTEPT